MANKDFSVTQFGKELDTSKYTWDEKNKTFSTNENNLVLDFSNYDNCTFDTGYGCTFKTGYDCTFKTGYDCTFKTGYGCTFKTGHSCTFDTGYGCTFKTGSDCTFKTGYDCTFDTGYGCTFKTGSDCTFKTGSDCVIVRRDVFEVIVLNEENNHIKLNKKGYKIIKNYEDMSKEELIKKIKELENKK